METSNNPIFYTDHCEPPVPAFGFNLNIRHHEQEPENRDITTTQHFTKEPMFEKPLTPSDVGKLNRLVIPKQHAEKHFPLGGCGDAADPQRGFLLSFEDESGKLWRFRYSYWNSSQSYVLTKGWSRYVKEKRLDAGDVVLFQRHRLDCERMFIGWRRRSAAVPVQDIMAVAQPAGGGWSTRVLHDAQSNHPSDHLPPSLPLPYQSDCLHAGGMYENVDNYQSSGNPRRVRLFGVNLECPDDYEPSNPDGSSQGQGGQPHSQYEE